MTSSIQFELREIPLSLSFARQRREQLLSAAGLATDKADYAVGIYDTDDRLLATASLDGDTIKGVAVDESVRSEQLTPRMVTQILDYAARNGIGNPKVFTKPEYAPVFSAMGFTQVGLTDRAAMLEHSTTSLADYLAYLRSLPRQGHTGCIVMHANPLTLGHMHLIETASRLCDTLFVIPVADNPAAEFTYHERHRMLAEATKGIANVQIVDGSHYAVSRQSFPSYFIKTLSDVTDTHISLDLDIFCRHIAPALDVRTRFVGDEPTDPLTARYNELMHQILPSKGIAVHQIARLASAAGPISASAVRQLLASGNLNQALDIVPQASVPALLAHAAAKALSDELATTPKPGLVDLENPGAHNDMDHLLMQKSIKALTPVFADIARASMTEKMPQASTLVPIGLEGEQQMMQATGGVNTHRGALFSMGLAVAAAAWLKHHGKEITRQQMRHTIKLISTGFTHAEKSNGAGVARTYGVPTALDYARRGFAEAFATDLSQGPHKALLWLMTKIEDSNVYHRAGARGALTVKTRAAELLGAYTHEGMRQLDAELTRLGISPGGAADMLALAMFIDSAAASDSRPHTDN